MTLPAVKGRPLVSGSTASWPKLTVTATDFGPEPARTVTWSSGDGGSTWQTA